MEINSWQENMFSFVQCLRCSVQPETFMIDRTIV